MRSRLMSFVVLALVVLTASVMAQGGKGKKGKTDAYSISVTALNGPSVTDVCVSVETDDELNYPLPSQLEKLQIKVVNQAGDIVYMLNQGDVPLTNGSACVSVTDLLPMMTVRVQAQVGTAKTGGKQNVEATTAVLLRPDLIVGQVNAPSESAPQTAFNIVAVVQETNAQSGASTTVGLWEGETLLANVPDVIVQAGGQVSLVFQGVSFAEAGTHNLTVRISDADPVEYDETNNEYPFSVVIVNSIDPVFYQLSYYLQKNYRRSVTNFYCGEGTVEVTTGGSGGWTYYTDFAFQTQSPIDSIKWESVSANGTLSTFAVYNIEPYHSTVDADLYYELVTDADGSWQSVSVSVNKTTQHVVLSTERYASDEVYVINYTDGTVERHETHSQQMNLDTFLEVRLLFADDGGKAGGAGRIDVAPFRDSSLVSYEEFDIFGCLYILADSTTFQYSSNATHGLTDPAVLPTEQAARNLQMLVSNMVLKNDLVQNYPNPFNPSTNIQFTVDRSGPTVLMIYDMLGREVAELFRGQAEKGRIYSFPFQASSVASGLYYARLYTSGRQYVKKMLLMK